jgi:hypothetical protein
MDEQDSNLLVQKLYDRIVATLTEGGDGNNAAFDPNKTFFTLEPRGKVINPADYAGAWTPGNPNGSLDAAAAICDLADEAPEFSSYHMPGPATVTQLYEQVLRATVTLESPPNPTVDAAVKRANDLLYTQTPNPDVPGQFITTQSPVYQNYQTNQTLYSNAITAYRTAYLNAMASPQLKGAWPLLAPSLQMPVHQAWHTWRSAQADQVEAALATLETSGKDQVKRAFADAAELFDSYKLGLDESTASQRRRCSLLPSDWYQAGVSNGWPTASFSSATATQNQNSDYTNAGGSVGFSLGLWSVGGGASSQTSHFHSDASAQSINISYQYALITIRRPWLNGLLFELPGWRTDVAPKGSYSSGSRRNQANTKFPLLPQAFLAIKNLSITGNFSSSEVNQANSAISANASVGWGPFSISGSYQHGSSQTHVKGSANSAGIHAPFVQIIGWVNLIVPFCPPE